MANMSLQKHPMPEQDPVVRAGNFKEVALGYTPEIAAEEAQRCLHCKNAPCVTGCPVNVPIPDFIDRIKEGDFEGAYQVIRSQNALPAAVFVRRRASARANVFAASRANRSASDVWNALRRILLWQRARQTPTRRLHAERRLQ